MASMLGKHKIAIEAANLADGDSIAAYLTSAAGALLTHTTVGLTERLDSIDAASHLDGSAYAAGVDYLMSAGAVDEGGNWQPLNINAAGELLVNAVVDFDGNYAEDSAHADGDVGIFNLAVRRDARSSGVDADGDYSSFNVNAVGELWVKDADVLAELLDQGTTLDAILADTATIDSQTLSIQNTLTALSKAEDAIHASGDQGIQALAVRRDTQGSNVDAAGDYSSLQTWSEGSLKVVDIANGSLLQQQVSVANTATLLPASALANRKSLMIQNTGSASIWVGSATVTASGATTGIELPKSSFMELEVGPDVSVYGITASGSQNANLLQMA